MSHGKRVFVLKFGGTSVKTVARMQHVADIISDFSKRGKVVVVVSAMGDTTDHLLSLASKCTETPDRRELDVLLSTGEQVSIALLSIVLRGCGLRAKSFTGAQAGIVTESCHGSARIVDVDSRILNNALCQNDVCVVAGFQGVTLDGDITTLGRGGSDTTAVALAAALKATECHIFTDVDGIFSADPNKVASAEFYPEIGYDECLRLVQAGAQVMHDRAVSLAKQYGVVLRVRNTFKPEHDGTLIAQLDRNLQRTCDEVAA
jgi:aspartate kinase